MDINFLGFKLTSAKQNSLKDFFTSQFLKTIGNIKVSAYPREVYVKNDNEYIYGLMVTVKDQKSYCELISKGGKKVIDVKNLTNGSQMMEFNFFLIDRKNNAGIFQHYHNSLSLSGLGYFLKKSFSDYNQSLIDVEINKIPLPLQTESAKRKIRKALRDKVEFKLAIRKEQLQTLIEEFKYVKLFEYEIASVGVVEKQMMQLSGNVKKKSTKLIFGAKTLSASISAKIANAAFLLNLKKGSIVGKDSNGVESTLQLIDNLGRLASYDYDSSLKEIAFLNIDDFEKCWIMKELKDVMKKNHSFLDNI